MNIKEVMGSSHRILDKLKNQTLKVLARAKPDAQPSLGEMTGYLWCPFFLAKLGQHKYNLYISLTGRINLIHKILYFQRKVLKKSFTYNPHPRRAILLTCSRE